MFSANKEIFPPGPPCKYVVELPAGPLQPVVPGEFCHKRKSR